MSPRARAFWPWLVSLVAIGAGVRLLLTTPPERVPTGWHVQDVLSYVLLPLSAITVGALVMWRQPRNSIGWLLASVGWIPSLQYVMAGYAISGLFGDTPAPFADVAAWLFALSGLWVGALGGILLGRFPSGETTERRGWLTSALVLAAAVFETVALAFRDGPLFFFREVVNPFGIRGADGFLDTVFGAGLVLNVVALTLGVTALLHRWSRAGRVESQQFKWFAVGMTLALAVAVVGSAFFVFDLRVAKFVIANGTAAVPIGLGVAILRYRLYDIDLLIKRSVVYGGTSVALGISFLLGIFGLQALLRPLTAGSELAIAASTLVSLALLQPVRRLLQDAVNRRFDRSRFDAARTVDAFADQLRNGVALGVLRSGLLDVVDRTMSPAHSSLWLRTDPPADAVTIPGRPVVRKELA